MRALWLSAAILLSAPVVAEASSMPRADFGDRPALGLSLGTDAAFQAGGSLSVDLPVWPQLTVGAGVGSTMAGALTYDVRAFYRFVEPSDGGLAVGGLVGAWGAPGSSAFQLPVAVAPFIGFGMAYTFMPKLTARLNLAYSPFYQPTTELFGVFGGPTVSGVEVAYQLTPAIAATLGLNGRGDIVGLNMTF